MAIVRRPPVVADRVKAAVAAVPTAVRAATPARTVAPAVPTPVRAAAPAVAKPAQNVVQAQTAQPARMVAANICPPGTARAGLASNPAYEGGCGKKIDTAPPACPSGQTRNAAGQCVPKQNNNNAGKSGLNLEGLGLDQKTINQLLGLYGKNTQYNPISSLLNAITNQKEYELTKTKQEAELKAAQDALARSTTGSSAALIALQQQLAGAGVPEAISTAISDYGTNAGAAVGKQYDNLTTILQNLYQGEGGTQAAPTPTSALGITQAGFDALQQYLQANPANAYALAKQAGPVTPTPTVTNDLAQYMAGQGVSQEGVTPTIEALNRAGQGGASNYQNLLNVLATQEAAGTQGRERELELARTLAGAGLGAEYTRQRGALTSQQLAALAQIAQTQGTQTLQAQRDAEARRQALQDAILKLQASGNTGCPEGYVKDPITSRCVPVPAE